MVLGVLPGSGYGTDHAAEVPAGEPSAECADCRVDQHWQPVDVLWTVAAIQKGAAEQGRRRHLMLAGIWHAVPGRRRIPVPGKRDALNGCKRGFWRVSRRSGGANMMTGLRAQQHCGKAIPSVFCQAWHDPG